MDFVSIAAVFEENAFIYPSLFSCVTLRGGREFAVFIVPLNTLALCQSWWTKTLALLVLPGMRVASKSLLCRI